LTALKLALLCYWKLTGTLPWKDKRESKDIIYTEMAITSAIIKYAVSQLICDNLLQTVCHVVSAIKILTLPNYKLCASGSYWNCKRVNKNRNGIDAKMPDGDKVEIPIDMKFHTDIRRVHIDIDSFYPTN
jgi:hypothetical protein